MLKFALLAALLGVAAPQPAAHAGTFSLYGPHVHRGGIAVWARQAAEYVPVPQVAVWVGFGSPMSPWHSDRMYLPRVGRLGWTAHDVQGEFVHELGHIFDRTNMTPAARAEFRRLAGVPAGWNWWKKYPSIRYVVSPDYVVKIAPGEMFAEEYAACASGLTQIDYQEAGFCSYGWVPPPGTDAALCALIRGAAS